MLFPHPPSQPQLGGRVDQGGTMMSQCRGGQGSQAVFVGLQVLAAGGEGRVEAGGEASNVCRDVGEDTRGGLVIVGDLK